MPAISSGILRIAVAIELKHSARPDFLNRAAHRPQPACALYIGRYWILKICPSI